MKKTIILIMILSAALLTGCGEEPKEETREPIPTLETAPPHSIPTYTATTVEFYSAETRSLPRYGTQTIAGAPPGFPEADTAVAFPDFADITADTAGVTADTGMMTADTGGIAMDTGDFGADTAAVNADTMDAAQNDIYIVPDTADTRY